MGSSLDLRRNTAGSSKRRGRLVLPGRDEKEEGGKVRREEHEETRHLFPGSLALRALPPLPPLPPLRSHREAFEA